MPLTGNDANWYSHFTPLVDRHIVNEIKTQRVLIFWGTKIDENATIMTDSLTSKAILLARRIFTFLF